MYGKGDIHTSPIELQTIVSEWRRGKALPELSPRSSLALQNAWSPKLVDSHTHTYNVFRLPIVSCSLINSLILGCLWPLVFVSNKILTLDMRVSAISHLPGCFCTLNLLSEYRIQQWIVNFHLFLYFDIYNCICLNTSHDFSALSLLLK